MNKTILIKSAADVFFLLILWSLFERHYAGLFFVAPYVLALFLFGSHQSRISYFSVVDVTTLLFISILIFSLHSLYLRSVPIDLVLFYSLSFVGLMALRLGLYAYHNLNLFFPNFKSHNKFNDIIIGAGEATSIYLSQKISMGGHVVGIFDDENTTIEAGRTYIVLVNDNRIVSAVPADEVKESKDSLVKFLNYKMLPFKEGEHFVVSFKPRITKTGKKMYLLWNVWTKSVMRMQTDTHKLWH